MTRNEWRRTAPILIGLAVLIIASGFIPMVSA